MIEKYKTMLLLRDSDPQKYFSDEMRRIAYLDNPYFIPIRIPDLDKIDIYTAKKFLEKCTNPADWTFVLTGNITPNEIRPFIENYIASIPQKQAFDKWAEIDVQRAQDVTKDLHKGKEDKSIVYSGRYLQKPWNEQENMAVSVLGEYLDIVMIQEIREKLGGVYTIYAGVSDAIVPPEGLLSLEIYFACDPKRSQELNTAIEVELKKIADGEINADTLEKARLALLKSFEKSLESNLFISRSISNYKSIYKMPLDHIFKRPEYYNNVSAEDLQNLMKGLLTKAPLTLFLYPENN
jgi:zinc protease